MTIKNAIIAAESGRWTEIAPEFPYYSAMAGCIQDPVYHGEGDVWTHTRMVYEQVQLANLGSRQSVVALYHDVAKPQTRTVEMRDGCPHVGHPKHSKLGAQQFWYDMWLNDIGSIEFKQWCYWMIRWHQRIFHTWAQKDMIRSALECQADVDLTDLIAFAKCDSAGRISFNQNETQQDLDLLSEWTEENLIKDALVDPYMKKFFFEKANRSVTYCPQLPIGSNAALMCGLPGSGKDTWIKKNLPDYEVVSLDALRAQMGVKPGDAQGTVVQAALEQARVCLRSGSPFVWNATNLTQQTRSKLISLFRDYDATVTIYAMDTSYSESNQRNRERKDPVPDKVIASMLSKWEPPSQTEAHYIKWIK